MWQQPPSPDPPAPTLFPNFCDGGVMVASCFLICLPWLNLETSSVSSAVCLPFLHPSLSSPLSTHCSSPGVLTTSHRWIIHTSPTAAETPAPLPLAPKPHAGSSWTSTGVSKNESVNPAPSHLSWSECG